MRVTNFHTFTESLATRWLSWYGVGVVSADRLPVVVLIPAGPLGRLKCDPPKATGADQKKLPFTESFSSPFRRRPDGSVGMALVLPALTDCRWWFESLLVHSGVSSATRRKATGADHKKHFLVSLSWGHLDL